MFKVFASASEILMLSEISVSIFCVDNSKIFMPTGVRPINVSLLSKGDTERFTHFFMTSLSMMRGTFELRSIILQPMSFTHMLSGCFPFNIRSTLYCSLVSPNAFTSWAIKVLHHHAEYMTLMIALCFCDVKPDDCMASSNFKTQMYVYTSKLKT